MRRAASSLPVLVLTVLVGVASPASADDIYGTQGDDRLVGSQGGDLISAKAGDDLIFGRAGFEDVWAGPGADLVKLGSDRSGGYVYGGLGDDRLVGSDGVDLLFGETGDDVLVGRAGGDHLIGGPGDNTFRGGQGDDLITLGSAGTADGEPTAVGEERVNAGKRRDRIFVANDGVVDRIECGDGADWVIYDYEVDPSDVLTGCEKVTVTQDPEGRSEQVTRT